LSAYTGNVAAACSLPGEDTALILCLQSRDERPNQVAPDRWVAEDRLSAEAVTRRSRC